MDWPPHALGELLHHHLSSGNDSPVVACGPLVLPSPLCYTFLPAFISVIYPYACQILQTVDKLPTSQKITCAAEMPQQRRRKRPGEPTSESA